jgi:hypothetical protein
MRKWRFPIALCVIQTAVTAVLTLWADRVDWLLGDSNRIPPSFLRVHLLVIQLRRVWRGVNAPTLPFNFAGQKSFQILGFSVPEILYLFAVAALWFLVGSLREGAKERTSNTSPNTKHIKAIGAAILIWGVVLFLFALFQIREAFPWGFTFVRAFNLVALVNVPLYALWAALLIRFGFKAMTPMNRRTNTGS